MSEVQAGVIVFATFWGACGIWTCAYRLKLILDALSVPSDQ